MNGIATRRAEALALHRQGRFGEAERVYRSILASAGDDGETWHYLAVLCGQTDRHAEALECCERALACAYRSAAVYANLANALATLGRAKDSAAALAGCDAVHGLIVRAGVYGR
ncbi:MAG: tetratricopeptide repeat protein, partial [Pseudomonadota bacterium]